jgi:hypothetical protein
MITVTFVEFVYPAPELDEEDYCPEGDGTSFSEAVGFRDLVRLMRDYPMSSCHPARGEPFEWLQAESQQDYQTGEFTECSLHYSRDNPARKVKYWRKAMFAAGIIQ